MSYTNKSKTKTTSGKAPKPDLNLASRHLGIITNRCLFWHQFLPNSVRNYYDVEDMIQEVVLYVIRQTHHYNPAKGRESTLVWHTTDNKCKTILAHFNTKKLVACETVELTPTIAQELPGQSQEEYRISLNAVERLIQYGSDPVVDLIDQLISGTLFMRESPEKGTVLVHFSKFNVPLDLIEEFRKTANVHKATMDDFLRVMCYASKRLA